MKQPDCRQGEEESSREVHVTPVNSIEQKVYGRKMKRKSSNNGKIAVRPHTGTIKTSALDKLYGLGSTYLHSEASRSTEDDALANCRPIPALDALQREIKLLERIGRDPRNTLPDYPVRERPFRAIFGSALWAWIGKQPGITMTAKEVEKALEEISRIEERRAEHGLDRDTISKS